MLIVHWTLFSTLLYLGVTMPQTGSLLLSLIFSQFSTEMIKQQMVARRADYRLIKNEFETRVIASASDPILPNER